MARLNDPYRTALQTYETEVDRQQEQAIQDLYRKFGAQGIANAPVSIAATQPVREQAGRLKAGYTSDLLLRQLAQEEADKDLESEREFQMRLAQQKIGGQRDMLLEQLETQRQMEQERNRITKELQEEQAIQAERASKRGLLGTLAGLFLGPPVARLSSFVSSQLFGDTPMESYIKKLAGDITDEKETGTTGNKPKTRHSVKVSKKSSSVEDMRKEMTEKVKGI